MKKASVAAIIAVLILVIIAQWVFIARGRKKEVTPARSPRLKGKIAIVLDDWGYNQNNLEEVKRIPYPFTASVLPNLPYTVSVAEELHSLGKEIILHLPMEPNEKYSLEKNTVLTSMPDKKIQEIVGEGLDSLPYAKGASNHMGSKITQDQRSMKLILNELKKRGLFFLDSLVSRKSVAGALAASIKIPFAKRDVFLDNKLEYAYIRQQVMVLKKKAAANGFAIGVGHDRKVTLEVLKEIMPVLEKEGFKFVFVSELVK